MSTADGSVVLDVNMNVSDAEKELARLKKKVFKLEDEIWEKEYNRNVLVQRKRAIKAEIAEIKKGMQQLDGVAFADNSEAEGKIEALRKQASELQKEIDKYDAALDKSTITLNYTKMRYGEILEISDQIQKNQSTDSSAKTEKNLYAVV